MAANQQNRRKTPWLLGIFVLASLTILVLLQSSNLWKNFSVDTASDTLLLYALSSLNFFAFVVFGFIFLRSILKLARERRAFQLGSRIKTRLLVYFAAVSLLPIIAMAGFSSLFMNRALERWFTQIPENVVREARLAQTRTIDEQDKRLRETAQMLAASIELRQPVQADIEKIAAQGNLVHIELRDTDGKILFSAGRQMTPNENEKIAEAIVQADTAQDDTDTASDKLPIGYRAASAVLSGGRKLFIVPDPGSAAYITQLAENSLVEFDRLKQQQVTVRQVGFLTLGVLTFLLIFASSWIAFYIARGVTTPIRALAEGASEIAAGNLAHRVDVIAEDELALLVFAFNQMSAKLEENSNELGERRRYIETVLDSLPTGVISIDADNRISTINRAAISILGADGIPAKGAPLYDLVSEADQHLLEKLISRAKRIGQAAEQAHLARKNTDQTAGEGLSVALTVTALEKETGVVLVIEDLSELITAQRAAAWQEVARRMAHEIKNPLTPIQLSAERIAKRFSAANAIEIGAAADSTASPQARKFITDGTDTILREVRSLKSMVDEFSRFARLPNANPSALDLNSIIGQVLDLYEDRLEGCLIERKLAANLPASMIDAEQMKRVFVNLIDNAIEAIDTSETKSIISISTRYEQARDIIVAEICDNGKGIAASDLQKLFQPYFSTKGRGTGLGLAIVHRIISEHGGKINVVANEPKGAKFIIELPKAG